MEERHRALLFKQNPQWTGKEIETPEFKRDSFATLDKFLSYKQIIAIIGLRRVGKTVLLKQLMKQLKSPENACYISFDDRDFQKYETAWEIVQYFLQKIDEKQQRFLFLDEIQKVPNWPDLLKTIYDTEKNLKIVISGSSSLELKQYKETLAGRILTFHIPVFMFKELVKYHGLEWKIKKEDVVNEYDKKLASKKQIYQELFQTYLLKGAFPELLEASDEEFVKKYISEVIDKIIEDVSKHIENGKQGEISDLIALLCKSTGRNFELNNIAEVLKINRNTASRYVNLLEKTFLIKTSYNYTKSVAKKLRISKKGYAAHSCVPISVLNYPFNAVNIDGSDLGHLVETAIASNLSDFSFWKHQNDEVDFIINNLPVEVKYQTNISNGDAAGLIKFMNKFKKKTALLVTKDKTEELKIGEINILAIPAWLFLLAYT